MSLTTQQIQKLMAYADGELDDNERASVEALLVKDTDAARLVRDVGNLGDFVRSDHDDRVAAKVASFDIGDAIMTEVSRGEETRKVASLAEARASRMKVGSAVVAALALAAGIFFVARPKETPMPTVAENPTLSPSALTPGMKGTVTANLSTGVTINAVQSPGQNVSVLYLPTANELSTSVVVWVEETGDK